MEEIKKTNICPICGTSERLFVEENKEKDSLEIMCLTCGFVTDNNLYKVGSDTVTEYEKTLPKLFIEAKYKDEQLDCFWYPLYINNQKGIIFIDGTNQNDWTWTVGKMVVIPIFERVKYEIPDQPGKYYETKIDVENLIRFKQNEFHLACQELGIELNKGN
jgi:hypothetical protein